MSIILLVQKPVQPLLPCREDFHSIGWSRTIAAFGSKDNFRICRINTHYVRIAAPQRRTQRILLREQVQAKGGLGWESTSESDKLQSMGVLLLLYLGCQVVIVCLRCVCRGRHRVDFMLELVPQSNLPSTSWLVILDGSGPGGGGCGGGAGLI
jgi:hypothetical protein